MTVRPPSAGAPGRPRLLGPTAVVLAVLLLLLGVGISLFTDYLWFSEVGFTEIFATTLQTKLLLFVVGALVMGVLVGANVAVAYRARPPFRPMSLEQQNLERYRAAVEPYLLPVLLLTSSVFGVFAGLSAASRWQTWLLWRNAQPFGVDDPQFERDISYYAMVLPMQRFALTFLLTAVVLCILAAAATHYLFGGVRLQSPGDKVSLAARAHLSVLIGVFVLLKAVGYYLDRYSLVFSQRGYVQGASYTDVNAVLPAKNVLIGIAVICSLLFFANIVVRNILLPTGALALLVLSAVVLGGVIPAYTQQFRVRPNEVAREEPFIERNIAATRAAYGIDDVEITEYDAKTDVSPAQLRRDQGTVPNARLLDPSVLSPTFEQFQRIRSYFGFAGALDVDRYTVGGELQDFVVAVREVDQNNLAQDQRNWINQHLTYTHGNGFVAAPANQVDEGGRPVFTVGNVPPTGPNGGPSPIRIDQPRIYFGEQSPDYSVVRTSQPEIDGPAAGDEQATFSYDGDGGVELSSAVRKLAYALKFREKNLLLSGAIKDESRLMYIRQPRQRVQKVAPFLTLDSDPYPAVVDGRILWIVDGYTTSDGYPYSQRVQFGDAVQDSQTRTLVRREVNYIRNSVKATVDAYTGEVALYAWDESDPVLKAWSGAFRGVVKPRSEVSAELESHFRYPEDLFKIQRERIAEYHVENARAFYNKEDFWGIPADPAEALNRVANQDQDSETRTGASPLALANARGPDQPPYYALLQLPGRDRASFNLTTSFTARGRPNLAAFASVSSEPEDYGRIRVLQLPRNAAVNGPGQVAALFEASPQVAETLTLLRRGGAKVTLGNLLTLPVGGGLLYVEPVYVQATGGESYPLLQRVIVSFGDKIAFEPTLGEALDALFGAGAGDVVDEEPGATPSPGTQPSGDLQAAIAAAERAFRAGQEALRRGDFAAYGEAQEQLRAALDRLTRAAGTRASASPSPAASPTG